MTSLTPDDRNIPKRETEMRQLYTPDEVEQFLRQAGFPEERIPQIMEDVRKGFENRKKPVS